MRYNVELFNNRIKGEVRVFQCSLYCLLYGGSLDIYTVLTISFRILMYVTSVLSTGAGIGTMSVTRV